jgi:membrane-bound metal-dependent hydrolase YbcI (DUF457 family)
MNTQTHIIIGAAIFGGDVPKRAWVGALGGVLPDIPMLLVVLVLKLFAIPDPVIFGFLYWQEWWQVTNAIAHNFWLWGGVFLLALFFRERASATAGMIDRCSLAMAFSASAFLHVAIDFLCHREDAHMSLWPVTRWKFMSPVSYYDPAHYGQSFAVLEALLGLVLATILFKRFCNTWVRAALAVAMLLYLAVPAYFILL